MLNRYRLFQIMAIFSLVSIPAFAAEGGHEGGHEGPCKQIVEACKGAGFVKGEAGKGTGLWMDCVDPIVQGKTSVPGATKPLPTVDASIVAACKAKRPNFGEGKVGTPPAPTTGSAPTGNAH